MAYRFSINACRYLIVEKFSSSLRYGFSIGEYFEIINHQVGLCQPQVQSCDSSSIASISQVPAR